ncbi:MAG: hypothetical protein QNJ02_13815 [Desulfobacterales bacterium]|nr:hypothetical protein [Desulfobacterales bacterium]
MFSDPVLIGGVLAGLAMGSFGYVLFRFAWRPTRRYGRLKKQIKAIVGPGRPDEVPAADRDRLRQLAVDLHALTTDELPHWFQLSLQRRGESPEEAVRQIQSLVNCRDQAALAKRRQAVCRSLGIITDAPGHRQQGPGQPLNRT